MTHTIWTDLSGTDFQVTTVDAGGVPTRSLQAGNGEAVIFLHGTSGHLEAFTRNIGDHARHYACHAIDMLGHGYTAKPDFPYEIPRYRDHLLAYMDAVGIESAHIVGESLGGWVGARTAIDAPERIASLQLLCAGGTVANPTVMERIRTSTRRAVATDDIELTRARMRLLMADDEDATEELIAIRHAIYHQPDFVANIDNLLCLQNMEVRLRNILRPEQLAQITAPTLIVWGRDNPFGEVPEATAMHEAIAGSELVLFDECGHWPQHEQAVQYNEVSLAFLAKHSG
ncbi:alpha/beta fold hydrolase [Sinosporangium siamense]|uniref:2-hydroxy-6-ketonona-2,4-dienedioic acid hydrolase n=1 Tax=Sinosporangium siamense TaxID=1367973 RepID=A0A919VAY9_9ACTN|nr:alpha/beta hydrolase [Sinosporangium siamense]GII96903.1 2-hydroxy-6-ketonona-2,4-dienedioic acid hydrolase [Sinosporangium siamense]